MSRLSWLFFRHGRTLSLKVSLYAYLGLVAAAAASLSSRYLGLALPFDISPSAIESLLGIIASSMLTVTTFSVNALASAYSSATSNGTPRATVLQEQDRLVQSVLATFIGSFLFSIIGLIALKISAYGPEGWVILFLVTIAVIVLIVVALIRWIGNLAKLGRVGDTIARLEEATCDAMENWVSRPFLGGIEAQKMAVPASPFPPYAREKWAMWPLWIAGASRSCARPSTCMSSSRSCREILSMTIRSCCTTRDRPQHFRSRMRRSASMLHGQNRALLRSGSPFRSDHPCRGRAARAFPCG